MIRKGIRFLKQLRSFERINMAFSRAAATAPLREIDPADPLSWEFSGFSQHGEDGIIDYLIRRLKNPNRYFIEIGAADGLQNNSSWLALARNYSGLMIDGDPDNTAWCNHLIVPINPGVEALHMFITLDNIGGLRTAALHLNPDVFSLDIDGNDFHIAEAILDAGMRPRIWAVEYNSVYGPEKSISVSYKPDFRVVQAHRLSLYSGCSIAALRKLMGRHGYHFVTVESSGTNAFFIDPREFEVEFLHSFQGTDFIESVSHSREYKLRWQEQFELIKDMDLVEI